MKDLQTFSFTYTKHHRLLLLLINRVVGAVDPRVGAQVPEPDVGVPTGAQKQCDKPHPVVREGTQDKGQAGIRL